jgi:hypothetical protein
MHAELLRKIELGGQKVAVLEYTTEDFGLDRCANSHVGGLALHRIEEISRDLGHGGCAFGR